MWRAGDLNRGRGSCPSAPAADEENSVGVSAALVARDHARAWPGPENARDCSVGSRRTSFSAWLWRLTMRTERGVGLRPTETGSVLGPASENMPATEDWMVECGAGPGGRLGSQDG